MKGTLSGLRSWLNKKERKKEKGRERLKKKKINTDLVEAELSHFVCSCFICKAPWPSVWGNIHGTNAFSKSNHHHPEVLIKNGDKMQLG